MDWKGVLDHDAQRTGGRDSIDSTEEGEVICSDDSRRDHRQAREGNLLLRRDQALTAVWNACAGVLHLRSKAFSTKSSFISLGGDSLAALLVNSRLREQGFTTSSQDILKAKTLTDLARVVQPSKEIPSTTNPGTLTLDLLDLTGLSNLQTRGWQDAVRHIGIDPSDVQDVLPSTPFQEGILLEDGVTGNSCGYQAVVHLRLPGEVDPDAINRAWEIIVDREDMLRTTFAPATLTSMASIKQASAFLQVVAFPQSPQALRVKTVGTVIKDPRDSETLEPCSFVQVDFPAGHIPVSATLVDIHSADGERQWAMKISIHHALFDTEYLAMIVDDLEAAGRGRGSGHPGIDAGRVPFSTFVRFVYSQDMDSLFWRDYLAGAAPALWPCSNGLRTALISDQMPRMKQLECSGDIGVAAERLGVSPAAIARAALAMTVAEHAGVDDVLFGEVSSGRPDIRGLSDSVKGWIAGPCATIHPVRIRLADETSSQRYTLQELLAASSRAYLDVLPHQYCGLSRIRGQYEDKGLLPFQVLFVYQRRQSFGDGLVQLQGIHLGQHGFPLNVEFSGGSAPAIRCTYSPNVIDGAMMEWFAHHLSQSLDALVQLGHDRCETTIPARVPLSNWEIDHLRRWSRPGIRDAQHTATANLQNFLFIDEIFDSVVKAIPAKIAVQSTHHDWVSYGELNRRVCTMAVALRTVLARSGVQGSEQPVIPIYFERGTEMVVAILAILKIRAAFVPLETRHPSDRLIKIVQTARASIIMCGQGEQQTAKLISVSQGTDVRLLTLSDLERETSSGTLDDVPQMWPQGPSLAAYVLFTSGSTGTPKGVITTHQNFISFLKCENSDLVGRWYDARLPVASYTFDLSIADVLTTLCVGGRVILVPVPTLLDSLRDWVQWSMISRLGLTSSLAAVLRDRTQDINRRFPFLRALILGGDVLDIEVLSYVPSNWRVWNAYGPAETTVGVTLYRVHPGARHPVPIGTPFGDNILYLIDTGSDERVPVGCVGEICVSGPQVSPGYLGQPGLTARSFRPDPFSKPPGQRMYRTGDLGRFLPDGNLEYVGRIDSQVKIRGQRVELQEIEAVISRHEDVKGCMVLLVDLPTGNTLVALCILRSESDIDPLLASERISQIRSWAAARLPAHMVPMHLFQLDGALPLLPSGKIDRRGLASRAKELASQYHPADIEPDVDASQTTEVERVICNIFEQVLGRPVSVGDSLMHLGGHSLLAVRAISLINQHFASRMIFSDVLKFPTAQALARHLEELHQNGNNTVEIFSVAQDISEIESAILAHSMVSNAAVVIADAEGVLDLRAFVTLIRDGDGHSEQGQVDQWEEIFHKQVYTDLQLEPDNVGRDFAGWRSTYDGSKIEILAMEEWLDDTIQTLLNGRRPGRVLEIGTGSGMILFNITDGLTDYVGLELVPKVAELIQQAANDDVRLAGKVTIYPGAADILPTLSSSISPGLVAINSVAQYFPSAEYLLDLTQHILHMHGVHTIFFGDVRSYPLYDEFLVSKAVHMRGSRGSPDDIGRVMLRSKKAERELLVDPGLFTSMASRWPELVQHVEILPKQMRAKNELSCYRYAAVIHVRNDSAPSCNILTVEPNQWIDFVSEGLDARRLSQRLKECNTGDILAMGNIPNRLFKLEQCILETMQTFPSDSQPQRPDGWQVAPRDKAACCPALSPADLALLAKEAGFQLSVSWARQASQRGGLDAIFHRVVPLVPQERVLFNFPTDHQGRSPGSFTNKPIRERYDQLRRMELMESLESQLPAHLVPSTVTVLDAMPLTAGGDIDRESLRRRNIGDGLGGSALVDHTIVTASEPENEVQRPAKQLEGVQSESMQTDIATSDVSYPHPSAYTDVLESWGLRSESSTVRSQVAQIQPDEQSSALPGYMQRTLRPNSRGTMVFIHPILGQSTVFEPLLPTLHDAYDVVLVSDPFFGQPHGPPTLSGWAAHYINALKPKMAVSCPIVIVGYSLGGLIALEMAHLWEENGGGSLCSLVLIDSLSYDRTQRPFADPHARQEATSAALEILGDDHGGIFEEHLDKLARIWDHSTCPDVYQGRALFIATPAVLESGAVEWWRMQCPRLIIHRVDCSHDDIFKEPTVERVGVLINAYSDL